MAMVTIFDERKIMEAYTNDVRKQGLEQGILKNAKDIAQRMIETGKLSLDEISVCSGLTLEQVKELKLENSEQMDQF